MNGLHSQVQLYIATRSQKSKNIIVFVSRRSPYGVLQYLSVLLIIQAGDIELNPGPAGVRICKFPCGMCHKAVRCDHRRPAICCDNCSIWYHKDCMNICSAVYASISKPEASWICYKCGVPNLSTSLFDSYRVDTSNSFQPLSDYSSELSISDLSIDETSVMLLGDSPIGSPRYASSPRTNNRQPRQARTKRLETLVVNIKSVQAKRESLWEVVTSSNPDIVVGCETWLSPSILNREVLPNNYLVYRYGGVLVGIRDDFISESLHLNTTAEFTAVKVTLVGEAPLIICSAYRPTNRDPDYLKSLCNVIELVNHTYPRSTIWVAGDFNLPDINWDRDTISGNQYPRQFNADFLHTIHNCDMEQIVNCPTRNHNTLDLFITNRPSLVNRCEVIPGISDHDIVYVDSNISAKRQPPIQRKIHLWKRANMDALKENARQLSVNICNQYSVTTPVEEMWNEISNGISNIMNTHVPSKMSSTRFSLHWVNSDVKTLKRRKQRYYNRARNSRTEHDW